MVATAACTSLGTTSPRYNRQQATKHKSDAHEGEEESEHTVFPLLGVALYHLVAIFEARERHFGDRILFVICLVCRQKRGICREREVNTGEAWRMSDLECDVEGCDLRNQVGLELIQIDVQGSVKSE
jgi:hypothetical protein